MIRVQPEWEWEYKELWNCIKIANDFPKITVIISTYKRLQDLTRAVKSILNQTYQNFHIIIVGDNCPVLKEFNITDQRITIVNLQENSNDLSATPKNHALYLIKDPNTWVTYLDDDNYFLRDHLLWYWYNILQNKSAVYGLSSIIMDKYNIVFHEPKLYRVDTSCIIHKKFLIDKYGGWDNKAGGYSHDWELVSRWVGREEYFVTKKCTVWYNLIGSKNAPEALYHWYGDQL